MWRVDPLFWSDTPRFNRLDRPRCHRLSSNGAVSGALQAVRSTLIGRTAAVVCVLDDGHP